MDTKNIEWIARRVLEAMAEETVPVPEKKQIKNRIRGIWQDRIFDRSEVMSTAMDYDSLQVILGAIFTVLE